MISHDDARAEEKSQYSSSVKYCTQESSALLFILYYLYYNIFAVQEAMKAKQARARRKYLGS